jgi:cell division transport system ATP-binding protein
VADEPTGNLDPETSIGIMQLLYRINRTGTTVVVATHDKEMVDRMRRRVIQLEQGRVIRDEAAGLYAGDESTREFAARMRDGDPGPDAELPVSRAGKRAARRAARREVDALPRELE